MKSAKIEKPSGKVPKLRKPESAKIEKLFGKMPK